jgi:hypothetical protein
MGERPRVLAALYLLEDVNPTSPEGAEESANDLMSNALIVCVRATERKATERKAIDDAFRPMASVKRYQSEALELADQFSASDAETLELSERDLIGP